jgi:hypothetical protein
MNGMMVVLLIFAGIYMIVDIWQDQEVMREQRKMRQEIRELRTRVNVNDEVITLHSEELDEIQRHDLAKRMVQELEEQSGKVCEISSGKADGHEQNV